MNVARSVEVSSLAELLTGARVVAEFGLVQAQLHVTGERNGAMRDGSPPRCARAGSQLALTLHLLMLLAMLRRADEHLDQVIVQAIEDLPLEGPLELRVIEIAGMQFEVVGVNGRLGKARTDDHLDGVAFGTSVEFNQRMLVEAQLLVHACKAIGSHGSDCSWENREYVGVDYL